MEDMTPAECKNSGLAVGICARKTSEEASEAIKVSFPDDRRGEMLFDMSLNNNQTPWNDWLRKNISKYETSNSYCLRPMKNFWSAAPFISDSYENSARLLKQYESLGYSFFILDYHPDEAAHVAEVVKIFRSL
jgi:alkanesulfonate monooxygenase